MELRPLSLGELLDHTFSYYRKYFLLFVGIMAVPQVLMVGVSLILQVFGVTNPTRSTPKDPAQMAAQFPAMIVGFVIAMGVVMLAAIIIYSVVHGATAYALSEVHLGRPTSVSNAFRSLRGKVWKLFAVVLTVGLRLVGVYVLLMVVILMAGGAIITIAPKGGPDPTMLFLVGLVMILAFLGGVLLAAALMLRYALAVPALVLENLTARDAIKRSVTLAKGNIWRMFLIFLLMYMISGVVVSIFQGPFLLAMLVIGARHGVVPFWLKLPMTISGGIGGALSGPLIVIALTLLYFDARVRKEGFDLQLMMANLNQDSPGAALPPAIAPPVPCDPSA